jgi:hypothetical protein
VWESTKARDTCGCAEGKAPLFAGDHSLVRVVPVAQNAEFLLHHRAPFVCMGHVIHRHVHGWKSDPELVTQNGCLVQDLDREQSPRWRDGLRSIPARVDATAFKSSIARTDSFCATPKRGEGLASENSRPSWSCQIGKRRQRSSMPNSGPRTPFSTRSALVVASSARAPGSSRGSFAPARCTSSTRLRVYSTLVIKVGQIWHCSNATGSLCSTCLKRPE